jgi:hypothetical protein
MNRRTLLKGIAGIAAGALILPPTLDENVAAARRYWALDQSMLAERTRREMFAKWVEAYEPRRYTIVVDRTSAVFPGDLIRIIDRDEWQSESGICNPPVITYRVLTVTHDD